MKAVLTFCAVMAMTLPAFAGDQGAPSAQKKLTLSISGIQTGETPLMQTASMQAQSEIRTTIEQQLRAIRERNDRAAYELASLDTDEKKITPQAFMREIRRKQPSLYNHVYFEILPQTGSEKFQKVKLIDRQGKEALAMFKMEPDNQGGWRVGNVVILKTDQDPI